MTKKIEPAIIHALQEALILAFWFKKDRRNFLITTLPDNKLISQLNWDDNRRNLVSTLIRAMCQEGHTADLLTLIFATVAIDKPSHLKRTDYSKEQYKSALEAIQDLKQKSEPLRTLINEREEDEKRRRAEKIRLEMKRATKIKLEELKASFNQMRSCENNQERGYKLEKFFPELFTLFEINAKGSFRNQGEQIDGAFTFDGTEYLIEIKWQKSPATTVDIDAFSSKVRRKLDNTLGLFVSINGFNKSAIQPKQERPALIVMDGEDLMWILEDRIGLDELLSCKKQYASRTGQIMIHAKEII